MYCKYCGKKIVEDNCDCEMAKAEIKETDEKRKQIDVCKLWRVFYWILKNPMDFLENATNHMDRKILLIIGALHLCSVIFAVLLGIPSAEWMRFALKEKFSVALLLAVTVGAIYLIIAAIIYGFNKIFKEECDFMGIIASLCSTTVVLSAGFVLAGFVLCFSGIIGAVLLFGILVAWIVSIFEVVKTSIKANYNVHFWIMVLITGVIALILICVGKSLISLYVENLVKDVFKMFL